MPTDLTMPLQAAQCYSNGVKAVTMLSFSTGMFSLKVSKDGTPCFSEEGTFTGADSGTITVKDAAGSTVATIVADATGSTVTCDGQTYTMGADCSPSDSMMPAPPGTAEDTCTMGTCEP